jgi:hypothetical protein
MWRACIHSPLVGAQIHMHEMVKLLTRAGHTVSVVTMASRHQTDWLRITTVCADPGRNCKLQRHFSISAWLRPRHNAPDTAMAMVYHGLIGPAVQHISAFMEQKLLPKIAPGSLVHATRLRREFLSRAACNLAPK